ncbi:putative sporulation protein YtxC [Clostridium sp. SYSU_GA19001]|uniref:putative sporulation protein YtxC n=1 Tax=Clostridium caldaquaticum TaxID=2940653 RepID=UPI0020771233|nr:putative sporulation protein YtxC [Clostridium caldaquaticum]MCM8711978.1 putative sporulation protein YtxC [Clostridium caldaquaticum]
MLLLTVVYDSSKEDIIKNMNEMKKYFHDRDIIVGFSESIESNTHFLKIFCDDNAFNDKLVNIFNLYMANILYNIVIDEFYKKEIQSFLTDTYFFLKYDEIKEIKKLSLDALKSEGAILNEYMVYFRNRKNSIIQKIIECIEENKEINIKGFITFRMSEFREDLESIIDKVVESYMVEKEYNEFIKLLKYFVELQESKIDKINIIIEIDGNYIIQDDHGNDIMDVLFSELSDTKFSGVVSVEDMLISGLITNAPNTVIIHNAENCSNKELLDTIKNVFGERVIFCSKCDMCDKIKTKIKLKK